MIFLNILPEELKQEIKFSEIKDIFQKIIGFIVLACVVYSAFLVYSNFILIDNLKIRKTFINNINSENNSNNELQGTASTVDKILKVQSEFFKPSFVIYDIVDIAGENISFSNLSIDKKTNRVLISGFAKTRDDLLNFKNKLSNSKNYSNINFPIENLLSKEKILFNISFDIKSYEY